MAWPHIFIYIYIRIYISLVKWLKTFKLSCLSIFQINFNLLAIKAYLSSRLSLLFFLNFWDKASSNSNWSQILYKLRRAFGFQSSCFHLPSVESLVCTIVSLGHTSSQTTAWILSFRTCTLFTIVMYGVYFPKMNLMK